jgi:hypothetical protein
MRTPQQHRFPPRRSSAAKAAALSITAVLGLSGCASFSVETAQLSAPEIRATLAQDKAALQHDVEPLAGPLTLDGAIARAIKYNADRRYRAMEEAVAIGTFEVGQFDMLPKVIASAGYRERNNDLITRSVDSVTGRPSLANPYISSSREATTADIGLSWSLLDFGQSYYAARQNADRVLIAGERRRKALHTLILDVRTAYWRVVAAQKLMPLLRTTIADSEAGAQGRAQGRGRPHPLTTGTAALPAAVAGEPAPAGADRAGAVHRARGTRLADQPAVGEHLHRGRAGQPR